MSQTKISRIIKYETPKHVFQLALYIENIFVMDFDHSCKRNPVMAQHPP